MTGAITAGGRETLVGLFLRHGANRHYLANLEPYLTRLGQRPGMTTAHISCRRVLAGHEDGPGLCRHAAACSRPTSAGWTTAIWC